MIKIANKMPITIILLFFSYFIAICGVAAGSLWMIFKFKDINAFIYGFLILMGSLLLAALIKMFANIGQMTFDIKADIQNSFRQAKESGEAQDEALIQNLQSIAQKLGAIKDNFDQMNCDSRDMNQNIQQIRVFFEQIERHLDLKK
ncbi:MAG: hypothetical protein WC616_00025 [Candidatus Omnitrophota bacterium]